MISSVLMGHNAFLIITTLQNHTHNNHRPTGEKVVKATLQNFIRDPLIKKLESKKNSSSYTYVK